MALTKISSDGFKDESVDLTKLPHGTASNDGKFLRANNAADPSFETINTDVANDTTPALGGNLDVNGHDIVSVSNADIDVVPHGAGKTNFGGSAGVKLPIGDNSERQNTQGVIRFNTDLGLAEYYNGTAWISIDSPPTISSINPTEVDSSISGNIDIVITGSNFKAGATVKFISNTGTEISASSVALNSATQLTATVARNSFVNAQEPYDVQVTNVSNLNNTLADALNVDASPVFSTPAGQIGGGFTGDSYSYTVAATDADGETVSYSLQSGSLPTGGSLNSTTGVISGTHPSVGSTTTFSFTIRATSGGKTVDRAFTIQSIVASAPTFYIASTTFTLSAPQAVIVTVIGGGGGGGSTPDGSTGGAGGGGGGMARKEYANLAAGNYTVTVGDKGAASPSNATPGGDGGTSSFAGTGITTVSATGGGGGANTTSSSAGAGGAGGVGSNGDTNGTGGNGGNGVTGQTHGQSGSSGSNGGAGGGGGGCDRGSDSSGASGDGGNGSSTYYTGGGGSGGTDRNGIAIVASQIGVVGTGYTSGGKGGGMGQTATAGGGNAGGAAGSLNGGPTPRNNFGGGGGSYGGGGGGAGSGDDLAYPQSGQGGGGAVVIVM